MFGYDEIITLGDYLDKSQSAKKKYPSRFPLGTALVLVALAFGGGYKLQEALAKSQLESKDLELKKKDNQIEQLKKESLLRQMKAELQTHLSRTQKAKQALSKSPRNKELQQNVLETTQDFAVFLKETVGKDPDENGIPIFQVAQDKESKEKSGIRIRGEGTVIPVSSEVKALTKTDIRWIKHDTSVLESLQQHTPRCPARGPISSDLKIKNGNAPNVYVNICVTKSSTRLEGK